MAKMEMRGPMDRDESVSVSVRRIDNGYIVSKSRSDQNGYTSSETFSKERPALEIEAARSVPSAEDVGRGVMRAAVKTASR